jgi:polysaccharide biosynthesis/export protein
MKVNLNHFPYIAKVTRKFKRHFLLFSVVVTSLFFHPVATGQADILSGLTPDQLAQFNQLPPAQRQALMSQLQLGSSAGLELPVTQPQTVTPRDSVSGGSSPPSSLSQIQSDINTRSTQRYRLENEDETDRDRIKRKAQQLFNLGIDLVELDTYGELSQMGIFEELLTPSEFSQQVAEALEAEALEEENNDSFTNFNQNPFLLSGQFGGGGDEFTNFNSSISDVEKLEDGEIRPFGYNLFSGSPSTFAPATDIPVPLDYVVGPGDTLVIQLYGQLNERYELAVTREGLIQFPQVGPLNVSGLSFEDTRELVQITVSNSLIGQEVSVSMGALRSIQVFVLGEAYRPGVYTVSSLARITNALFSSGGISNVGSLRNIQLLRSGELVTELDFYDLLFRGDTSADARLQPNDVIFIESVGNTVGVSGEVLRPSIFELNGQETVEDVVSLSGGLLPTAYPALAHLERINSLGQRTILDIDLTDANDLSTLVVDGDLLFVDSILDQIESGIFIEGHVNRPGSFAWQAGIRISELIRYQDFLPNSDLEYALLVRETQPSRNIEVMQVNLTKALGSPESIDDLILQPRDRLLIFGENSLENRLDRRLLIHPIIQTLRYQANRAGFSKVTSINGEVNAPGDYPLVMNMTIYDLLLAAGGLVESADLNQAELIKRVNTPEVGMVSQNIQMDLSNSLNINSALGPLDRLTIRQLPNWSEIETVSIGGEVRSPGRYVISKDDSLSDLINRAGGLTEYADPKAGIFLREELRRNEQRLLNDFNERLTRDLLNQSLTQGGGQIQQPQVNIEVMNALLAQIESAVPTGRLVINLPALLSGLDPSGDVILRDGDELIIPRTRQEIGVVGEVQLATSHLYNLEDTVSDYINRSGGFTRNADEDNIYVIKSNGAVIPYSQNQSLFSFAQDRNSQLEAGDSIVIPYFARLNNPLITWTNISTVLFNLATTLLAIESVGN